MTVDLRRGYGEAIVVVMAYDRRSGWRRVCDDLQHENVFVCPTGEIIVHAAGLGLAVNTTVLLEVVGDAGNLLDVHITTAQ